MEIREHDFYIDPAFTFLSSMILEVLAKIQLNQNTLGLPLSEQ